MDPLVLILQHWQALAGRGGFAWGGSRCTCCHWWKPPWTRARSACDAATASRRDPRALHVEQTHHSTIITRSLLPMEQGE
jgi:hypothetical protein